MTVSSVLPTDICPPSTDLEPCRCGYLFNRLAFSCYDRGLGDEKISQLLDQFISTPGVGALRELYLWNNNLTRIPDQIRHFTELDDMDLSWNEIRLVKKGSFNLIQHLERLLLYNNMISSIESGAFNGIRPAV